MARGRAGTRGGWADRTRLARIVAKRLEKMTGRRVRTVEAGRRGNWNEGLNRRMDDSRRPAGTRRRSAAAARYTDRNWDADTTYHVNNRHTGSNYVYQTDSRGRVVHAEGELTLRSGDRNTEQQVWSGGDDRITGNANRRDDDAGGHLFGTQFGGAGEGLNMVPQAARQNSGGDWQAMENDWKDALEAKKDVYVKVEPIYSGNSERPDEFEVSYTIREVDDAGNVKPVTTRKTIPNA